MGDYGVGGGANEVTAGGGDIGEVSDDGLSGLLLELKEEMMNGVAGGHSAARAVDFEEQGLYGGVLSGAVKLFADGLDGVFGSAEESEGLVIGDGAGDLKEQDLVGPLAHQDTLLVVAVSDAGRRHLSQPHKEDDGEEKKAGEEEDGGEYRKDPDGDTARARPWTRSNRLAGWASVVVHLPPL